MKTPHAEFVRSATSSKDFLRDGRREVAFVGRSNVGKSTLLNRLLGRRKLARTSSTPGRTRAVNYFLVGDDAYFVDLPGYGYAKAGKADRAAWASLVEDYFRQADERLTVVLLVDGKVGATPLDVQAHDFLTALGVRTVVVATKLDRIKRSRQDGQLRAIAAELGLEEEPLALSGVTGAGVDRLWSRLSPSG